MGKYLKKFSTDPERVEYEGSENYLEPYVSLVEGDNSVHYNKFVETRVVATYNVTSTSSPTPIGYEQFTSAFTEIEIDGVVQPTVVSAYTFDTLGEHTVKYTLSDPTSIGNNAFQNCSGLVEVTIPNSVTSIGYSAFRGCSGLTDVTILDSVTSIGANAFNSCSGLTSVTIGNSVTSIGGQAFYYCSGLISVTIPDSVTSIGDGAFYGCTNLSSVTIGSGVTSIGNGAFQACGGLTNVTIGSGVTSIGQGAFAYCTSLNTITSYIMAAPSVNPGTFNVGSYGGTLYVPIGSSGYETWMDNQGNLGYFNWTKVEQ